MTAESARSAPDVSVVVPTSGRVQLLRRALDSALAQQDVALEVIVVVDAAPVDTESALAELGDPRVRSLRTPGGVGPAIGRNLGLEAARGAWVSFLDDDDLWSPHKLRAQLDAAAGADAAWCYTEAVDIDSAGEIVGVERPPEPTVLCRDLRRLNLVPAGASNLLVRTDVLRELGGFDPELTSVTDWDLALRLSRRGMPAMAPGLHIAYRRHGANMHASDPSGFLSEIDRLEAKHADIGLAPNRVEIVRWLAGAQRRAGQRGKAARLYLEGAVRERNPGNAVRAAGALGGERVMAAGRRMTRGRAEVPREVEWLQAYI
jgi:GT2 family glycosyltransferase